MERTTRTSESHPGFDFTEFREGWRVLLLALIGVITSAGVLPLYTFPVLLKPLALAMGWTRGELQVTVTFFFIGLVVASQLAGPITKRLGMRKVAMASCVLFAMAYALLSFIGGSIWTLYAGYVLLVVAGAGTLQITWTHLTNLWFDRHRGLALAIVLCGTGLSNLLVLPALSAIVDRFGWAAGFVSLACLPMVVTLPLTWLWMRDEAPRPRSAAAAAVLLGGLPYREVLRGYRFWVMCASFVLVVSSVLGILTNAMPLMLDRGLPAVQAAQVFSINGAALIVGRLGAGFLIDRMWAPGVAWLMMTLPAVGCALFVHAGTDLTWLLVASALVGIGAGAEYDVASFLFARYFGMLDYSRTFGTQFALVSAGVCVAPLMFGALIDRTGSYDALLWVCAAGFVGGAGLLLSLGRYPDFAAPPLPSTHTARADGSGPAASSP